MGFRLRRTSSAHPDRSGWYPPAPPRVFYGWWVIAAGLFIALYTAGAIIFGFTAVFEPIVREFGWPYAQVSLAASLLGMETGLLAPLVGFLVDRWGARRWLFLGLTIVGLGLMLLSQITSLAGFYGASFLISLGMSVCSTSVFLTAAANWFRKRIALTSGIAASGFALGGTIVPAVAALIDRSGWRTAMVVLGVATWVICLPLSLVIRHRPEQHGLLPDGDLNQAGGAAGNSGPGDSPDTDYSAGQALRTRAFWHIALAFMFQMLVINAVVVHVMPFLSSVGVSRAAASLVASATPVASVLGRLTFGWLGDRLHKRRLMAACFIFTGLGMASFGYMADGTAWLVAPFLLFFSTGWGGGVTIRAALLREYFGRKSFGTILGFTMGIVMLGNLAGPPLAGWAFDRWSDYRGIWLAFAGLAIVSVVLAATTPPNAIERPPGKAKT
ncbi:MAG: MFS transporter [Chloroflexi bacterium]|nr:MFS transporter [Chloroflexota bacterium]